MAISNAENENIILSGMRKAAIAIVALGDDVATEVFRLLTERVHGGVGVQRHRL